MSKIIYFDHAATTPCRTEAVTAMLPYFSESFGNPSSVYSYGRTAKTALDRARQEIADCIKASPEEIFFTSGGTEANNWAITEGAGKGHVITTAIEHYSVLRACQRREKLGLPVSYLAPDRLGLIATDKLELYRQRDTRLISVMMANNEIGTVLPVREIASFAKEHGILSHTDAVQAVGHVAIDVDDLGVDMLSASAHKFGGPKGVGFLYVRKGVKLPSLLCGGNQERGRRPGTENVPGIVGMARALKLACDELDENLTHVNALRTYLTNRVLNLVPGARLNGAVSPRLPGIANFCIAGIPAETLLIFLDQAGVCCSAGSACASGALEPSHVLMGIGLSKEDAQCSLRFSLGAENTFDEVDEMLIILLKSMAEIRLRMRENA